MEALPALPDSILEFLKEAEDEAESLKLEKLEGHPKRGVKMAASELGCGTRVKGKVKQVKTKGMRLKKGILHIVSNSMDWKT